MHIANYLANRRGVYRHIIFLGELSKLRKETINFVMSVCPSVHSIKKLGSLCENFYDIWYLNNFRKYFEKIQVSLESDKN